MKDIVSALRFHRFGKNLVVIPAMAIAGMNPEHLPKLFLSLFGLLIVSSASYLLNEYLDRKNDLHHPLKSQRAFIQTNVNLQVVIVLVAIMYIFTLFYFYFLNQSSVAMVLAFILSALIYNCSPVRTKDRPVLDLITESLNAPLRLQICWMVVFADYAPLSWTGIYFFINFSCMSLKRYFEFRYLGKNEAIIYRPVYRYYSEKCLMLFTYLSLIPLALFVRDYSQIAFSLLCISGIVLVTTGKIRFPERFLG